MIKFAVPYNGDPKLIDIVIEQYPEFTESFFGNFGIDNFGGGRAQNDSIVNSSKQLRYVVSKLKDNKIDFNYVINNTSLMNDEFTPTYLCKFNSFVKKLIDFGVTKITLSNPFLIQHVKSLFPAIKISASVNLKTRSVEEVKYLIQLGCDEATLHYDLIKNFKELKAIRLTTDMLLKLIPNDLYIMNCPWQKGHTRMQASHSKYKEFVTPYFSYYRNKCVKIRTIHPEQIFMGKWIAPQDIEQYTAIGYNNFKILDRLATTNWILNVMRIYIEQKKSSNLEEILGTYGRKTNIDTYIAGIDETTYPIERLEAVPCITQEKGIPYWFSEKHLLNCSNCHLCQSIIDKQIVFPENVRNISISNNEIWQNKITKRNFIELLNSSKSQRISYK